MDIIINWLSLEDYVLDSYGLHYGKNNPKTSMQ